MQEGLVNMEEIKFCKSTVYNTCMLNTEWSSDIVLEHFHLVLRLRDDTVPTLCGTKLGEDTKCWVKCVLYEEKGKY